MIQLLVCLVYDAATGMLSTATCLVCEVQLLVCLVYDTATGMLSV